MIMMAVSLILYILINEYSYTDKITKWAVTLLTILIFQINHIENNKSVLLTNAPPNLLQNLKKIFLESIIEALRNDYKKIVLLLVISLYINNHQETLSNKLIYFISSSTQSIMLLAYLNILYKCIALVLLYPLNFNKLQSVASTNKMKSNDKIDFNDSITCMLAATTATTDSQSTSTTTSVIETRTVLSTIITSTNTPKWQLLNKVQSNYLQKYYSKYDALLCNNSFIEYFIKENINKQLIDGIQYILQALSLQYMNNMCRINTNWKLHIFSNELTFYEIMLKNCSIVDNFTLQV